MSSLNDDRGFSGRWTLGGPKIRARAHPSALAPRVIHVLLAIAMLTLAGPVGAQDETDEPSAWINVRTVEDLGCHGGDRGSFDPVLVIRADGVKVFEEFLDPVRGWPVGSLAPFHAPAGARLSFQLIDVQVSTWPDTPTRTCDIRYGPGETTELAWDGGVLDTRERGESERSAVVSLRIAPDPPPEPSLELENLAPRAITLAWQARNTTPDLSYLRATTLDPTNVTLGVEAGNHTLDDLFDNATYVVSRFDHDGPWLVGHRLVIETPDAPPLPLIPRRHWVEDGNLTVSWGYREAHDGQRIELHLGTWHGFPYSQETLHAEVTLGYFVRYMASSPPWPTFFHAPSALTVPADPDHREARLVLVDTGGHETPSAPIDLTEAPSEHRWRPLDVPRDRERIEAWTPRPTVWTDTRDLPLGISISGTIRGGAQGGEHVLSRIEARAGDGPWVSIPFDNPADAPASWQIPVDALVDAPGFTTLYLRATAGSESSDTMLTPLRVTKRPPPEEPTLDRTPFHGDKPPAIGTTVELTGSIPVRYDLTEAKVEVDLPGQACCTYANTDGTIWWLEWNTTNATSPFSWVGLRGWSGEAWSERVDWQVRLRPPPFDPPDPTDIGITILEPALGDRVGRDPSILIEMEADEPNRDFRLIQRAWWRLHGPTEGEGTLSGPSEGEGEATLWRGSPRVLLDPGSYTLSVHVNFMKIQSLLHGTMTTYDPIETSTTFVVDDALPTISLGNITVTPAGEMVARGEILDPHPGGTLELTYRLDGGAWRSFDLVGEGHRVPFVITADDPSLATGDHTLVVKVTDGSGSTVEEETFSAPQPSETPGPPAAGLILALALLAFGLGASGRRDDGKQRP